MKQWRRTRNLHRHSRSSPLLPLIVLTLIALRLIVIQADTKSLRLRRGRIARNPSIVPMSPMNVRMNVKMKDANVGNKFKPQRGRRRLALAPSEIVTVVN
jgi:hypothetical protein